MANLLSRRNALGAALCCAVLWAPGCSQSMWRQMMGEGFNDDMAKSGQKLRSGEKEGGDYDGLSTKSRQVERDLGV